MVVGKDSIKKFGILAALVLAGVMDIIFAQNRVVARINSILIALEIGWLGYNLFIKWSRKNYNNKK